MCSGKVYDDLDEERERLVLDDASRSARATSSRNPNGAARLVMRMCDLRLPPRHPARYFCPNPLAPMMRWLISTATG